MFSFTKIFLGVPLIYSIYIKYINNISLIIKPALSSKITSVFLQAPVNKWCVAPLNKNQFFDSVFILY